MIYSSKQFNKSLPKSLRAQLARVCACVFLTPFVLAIAYVLVTCFISGFWLLAGLLGDPAALIPYAFCAFIFLVLWINWEVRRNRKLYRKYMSEQSMGALENVVLSPEGIFTKSDRKIAAEVIHACPTGKAFTQA